MVRAVTQVPIVKAYFDYKSPFAYLAFEPALDLTREFNIELRWIPYLLHIKGKGQRSIYSEWKVRYSYMDARRLANRRDGFLIRGPRKVYDSTPALLGALYAMDNGCFVDYSRAVFSRFFTHQLEVDQMDEVSALLQEVGLDQRAFEAFAQGPGMMRLEQAIAEGEQDHVFGVPLFVFADEQFWGNDRIWLLRERLAPFKR